MESMFNCIVGNEKSCLSKSLVKTKINRSLLRLVFPRFTPVPCVFASLSDWLIKLLASVLIG